MSTTVAHTLTFKMGTVGPTEAIDGQGLEVDDGLRLGWGVLLGGTFSAPAYDDTGLILDCTDHVRSIEFALVREFGTGAASIAPNLINTRILEGADAGKIEMQLFKAVNGAELLNGTVLDPSTFRFFLVGVT